MIYKRCENPFQIQSTTNHSSVDGCQQHHELPCLLQTCGMCRDRHFKREIIFHVTIHYTSSLPDCPHKSPNSGLKRSANSLDLKKWKQNSCSMCSWMSIGDLERPSAGSAAVTHSCCRLLTASRWLSTATYAVQPQLQTLLVTSAIQTNKHLSEAAGINCFPTIILSGLVWCVLAGSALVFSFVTVSHIKKLLKLLKLTFSHLTWETVHEELDGQLIAIWWEDKVCTQEDDWILFIPRELFVINYECIIWANWQTKSFFRKILNCQ